MIRAECHPEEDSARIPVQNCIGEKKIMWRGFLPALVALLMSADVVLSQSPIMVQAPVPSVIGPEDVLWSALPPPDSEFIPEGQERVWFNVDYLLWWVRPGSVSRPLVTSGSPLDDVPGALGQKGTAVLFGNQTLNFGTFSGLRLNTGFDLGEGWSVDAGYFGLERRAIGRTFNSDGNGNPLIARPYFDNQAGTPAAYVASLPDAQSGGVTVRAQTRLQGYELNVNANMYSDSAIRFDLLAGFRTLELSEDLLITDTVTGLVPGQVIFLNGPADPPSSLTAIDHFRNYNHFYGGQLGGKVHWQTSSLDVGITGKVAIGTTQQLAILDGSTSLNTPGAGSTANPGGVLVQPTNIGRFFQSRFGVVPEFALDLGYWLTPQIRLALGYQFLYWNGVSRPGNEIDTTVNPSQVPRDPRFSNGLGDARPTYQFHQSDFWAQGFNFGVLFQY